MLKRLESMAGPIKEKLAKATAEWYRNVAIAAGLVALMTVVALEVILKVLKLPLWLHIPLAGMVLGLITVSSAVLGIALLEFRSRSVRHGEKA
jgi:hypothetical protein